MAEVAKVVAPPGCSGSDTVRHCGGAMKVRPVVKRKTPSQLREEQLKRRIATEGVHAPAPSGNADVVDPAVKKPEGPRSTRYVDKRLDEVYPARKPNSRLSLLTVKSNLKGIRVDEEKGGIKSSFPSHLTSNNHYELKGTSVSVGNGKNSVLQQCQTAEKDNASRFRNVAELSLGSDRFAQTGTVDVDKALKGLAPCEASGSYSPPNIAGKSGDLKSTSLGNFISEIHIPGRKVPLDFTLKTTMRIASSAPVDQFHRLLMGGAYNGVTAASFQFGCTGKQSRSCAPTSPASADSFSLHSWLYPQSSLPPSVMSILSSSAGGGEMDFLNKRQLAWEESFRCLYYMLRKSACSIFYACTSQFVVMFTAVGGIGKSKRICNAYISQSTRGLRSLLKEHDISFSMPFCSEMEQISSEDLVELSEIEKHNLGQAKRMRSMPDLDNSPTSLLAFNGNYTVHGLYDFLLNYRSLLTMLSGVDVPVLCAPVPFLNAALSSPEVRCKEIRRADVLQTKGSDGTTSGISYSIEIKDSYLPPWIICSICAALGSDGRSFEASFMTEPNSMGLNAALEMVCNKSNTDETSGNSDQPSENFGISTATVTSELHSASLKGLKYSNGSYAASLSPI